MRSFWELKLRKLKTFDLLQTKEKLKRQKSLVELGEIEADSKKCQSINDELQKLLDENSSQLEATGAQSFISNRRLMHKMLDQRQIINNRLEFLATEKSSILSEVGKSMAKDDIFKRKKQSIKREANKTAQNRSDATLTSIKRDL